MQHIIHRLAYIWLECSNSNVCYLDKTTQKQIKYKKKLIVGLTRCE